MKLILSIVLILFLFILITKSQTIDTFLRFSTFNWLISDGKSRIAWVNQEAGVSNVFIASSMDGYIPRQRTKYNKDNGTEIDDLVFSPDGNILYYTYRPIDNGNPTGAVIPPVSQIVYLPFDFNENPRTLVTEASIMAVSAYGVTFVYGNRVFEIDPETTYQTNLFSLQSDQGYVTDFKWSPDGKTLAFTNYRGDHAFIGLYRRNSLTLEWISPSFDIDATPAWSPDGQKLAFYRFRSLTYSNGRQKLLGYSVLAYDLVKNASVQLYRDWNVGFADSYGFGYRSLMWIDGDTIVFPNEASGWLHVSSVSFSTGKLRDLTPGLCETQEYIARDKYLYISNNCDEIDSRGIRKVNVVDGTFVLVVEGDINNVSGMADGGYGMVVVNDDALAYLQTSYNNSTQLFLFNFTTGDNFCVSCLIKKTSGLFSMDNFVKPSLEIFPSLDGLTLHSQLFQPPNMDKSGDITYPAVIFTHGGPMRQMFCAFHYSAVYAQLYAINQYLAYNNFVVLSVNYRAGIGYGKKFRDCDGCKWLGGSEYQDVVAAQKYLANLPYVDANRIGIYGLSYGGLNTLQALSRNSNLFKAGVANAPIFNWISANRFDGDIIYDYMPIVNLPINVGPEPNLATPDWPRYVDENLKIAYVSSPVAFVANFTSPVLVIQGDSDRNVDVQESIGLIRALQDKGDVIVESMMFANEIHGLSLYSNQLIAAKSTYEFLRKYI